MKKKRPPTGKPEALYLTPEQAESHRKLNDAIDQRVRDGPTPCQIPEIKLGERGKVIRYYPHADYDGRIPPDNPTASRMCRDCPVIAECFAFAETILPESGVWGGVTWIEGTPEL